MGLVKTDGLRLILMRHAKSSWESGAQTDHERPLNKRGQRDAPRVAAEIASAGWSPTRVLSSDSTRTRETWLRMAPELVDPPAAAFEPSLYHAGLTALSRLLVGSESGPVLALGHNPGWEHALGYLSGDHRAMKTACAALLKSSASAWDDGLASPKQFELVRFIAPRELD